jgi:hypothetical protein
LGAEELTSVALFSRLVGLRVDCRRVDDVDPPVATPATELESVKIALAEAVAVAVAVETTALLLLEGEKAKARTAGAILRLVKHNIHKNMDKFRVTKSAEDGGDDGIQFEFGNVV